jgi:glycosyltransferase involved in cell wall biosynthesis
LIYICIPAHDEAQTIGVLLWKIRRVMAEFPRDYQILVLDDASTDHTAEALEPYTRVLPLSVIRGERRTGYAAAVERLLREASARSTHPKRDTVVVMQGDFTESPDDLPNLIKRIEGGADVVGSVARDESREPTPRPLRWSRRGLPLLLKRARLPREAGDPLSGFRAYRVATLRRALAAHEGVPLLRGEGWAANVELLRAVLPHARRAEHAEVTLRYDRRDRPTRFNAWSTVKSVWDVARRPSAAPPALAAAPAAPGTPDAAPPAPPQDGGAEARPRRPRPRGRRKPKQKPEGDASHAA